MKFIEHLIADLGRRGIVLRAEGERLHVNAPKGAMTAELAARIRSGKAEILTYLAVLKADRVVIPKASASQMPVLSFAQQRMWFLDQLEGKCTTTGAHYNIPLALRLQGNLDHSALERSFSAIRERHDALRALFPSHEGEPRLLLEAAGPVSIPVHDLRTERAPFDLARTRVFTAAASGFDLARGPLWRVELMRLADDDHVLCLVMHHIISDGWSCGVLVGELTLLYAYFLNNDRESAFPLAPLAIQYSDFACWQKQRLSGEVREGQINYWKEKLAGIASLHQVPSDRPRPRLLSYRGADVSFSLEVDLSNKLERLAGDSGASLFMVLQAAFATLLFRYSGGADLCIGTPIANRNHKQLEPLIGLFVNTLVLRNDLTGDPRFSRFLERVKATALEAYDHQDIPFEQILDSLDLERTLSYSPIFQIMFSMVNTPAAALELPDLSLSPVDLGLETAKFDLNLTMNRDGEQITGSLEFNTDLFDRGSIDRMINHFCLLLASIVAEPEQRLSRLRILKSQERDQMLRIWNNTDQPGPGRDCIHHLFEQQVARTPESLALLDETMSTSYSYAQLNQWADELALVLRAEGVGPWTRVGLMVERSAEMIAGIYAILKAGGAYVPIDPTYPSERIAFILEDSAAPVLLTRRSLCANLPQSAASVLCLDEPLPRVTVPPAPARVEGDHLVYIIYTSGSTGRPKGAGVYHRSFCNLVHWFISDFELSDRDRVLLTSSVSFDLTQKNIYAPLLVGGSLHLAPPSPYDPAVITELVARRGISWLNCTPSAFYPLIEDSGPGWEKRLASLRWVFLGGEPISIARLRKWLDLDCCAAVVVNTYGPTECTDISNFKAMHEPLLFLDKATPIGRPVYNVSLLVLDLQLGLLPLGGQGELCIYGLSVGPGYLRDPRLTAAKFLPNPYALTAGERIYRTGDLVRYLPDGDVEFLGRMDHQVKIRGFRIELGEVEAALIKMPLVREAVAVIREAGADKQLVAFIQLEGAEEPDFRAALGESLPDHLIPSRFTVLDSFPLTPSGKVDRKALPEIGLKQEVQNYLAPRNETEQKIAAIWAEILGEEKIGVFANFFKLGGHSLLATRVISRICDTFALSIPLQAIFEAPSVAGLAEVVKAATGHEAEPIPLLPRDPEGTRLPLSFAQERLWFLYQLEGPSATYNIPLALRLSGVLDIGLMADCIGEMVRRHEALRTSFPNDGEMPLQLIDPVGAVTLTVIDLSGLGTAVRDGALTDLVDRDGLMPFQLEKPPLLRVTLLRLGDDQAALLVNKHHIISDGWSLSLFAQELVALYVAFSRNLQGPPELSVQYADYAVWQRQWLEAGVMEQQLTYWKNQLGGEQPPLALATDRVRPAIRTFSGASLSARLETEQTQRLHQLAREEEGTLFMSLLGAFYLLLQRHTGQDEISVGTPIAGRTRTETEAMIGFFLNTLVLRADLGANPSFRELLRQVRAITVDAYNNQDVPFEKLLEVLQPERDPSRTPLFQVFFNMLNLPEPEADLGELKLEAINAPDIGAKFDLTFYLTESEGGVGLDLHYNADLFGEQRMAEFLDQFLLLLDHVGRRPDLPIGDYSLRTIKNQHLLPDPTLVLDAGWPGSVHELFAREAQKHPLRIAVRGESGALSYGDLQQRAHLVSAFLGSHGIQRGDIVAVLGVRCPSLIVAIYGILEAGAAFTILDPAYPPARLGLALDLTEPKAWIYLESAGELHTDLEALLAEIPVRLDLPADGRQIGGKPWPETRVEPDDLAYISFTSGSTGKPKGIMGRHGSLTHFMPWLTETFAYDENDRFSMLSGLSHDPLQRDIFTPLSLGACLYIPSRDDIDPGRLAAWMNQNEISVAHLTPAMAQLLTEPAEALPSLRLAYLTGDVLTRRDVVRLRSVAADVVCVNSYGTTETQRAVGVFISRPDSKEEEQQVLPLGIGAPDVQLLILGQGDRLVGLGEIGEIHVRSPHIALGYHGEPVMTRERFIPNPFSDDPRDKLYRCGDLGYYRPDGNVVFAGRADHQVKIRGFRIETRDIEAALAADPAVREAVVLAHEDAPGQRRLIAYVLLVEGAETTGVAPVRKRLRKRVPDYMVPAHFVPLEKLPLNPNGKIDRAALPLPESVREKGSAVVLPKTATEEMLAGIWHQLLSLDQVGRNDHFFDLGGHSLLAAQVISRVRAAFDIDLPLRNFFITPTLAALASEIEKIRRESKNLVRPKLVAAPRTARLPLSFAQQRLWFIDQFQGPSATYNMPAAARLRGSLRVPVLERAFQGLVARHESLRTCFPADSGQPYQLVQSRLEAPFHMIDLSRLEGVEDIVEGLAREDAQRPFNLETGPVIRASLVRLAADDHVFLLGMHHMVSDAWSVALVFDELGIHYAAMSRDKPSPLEPLPIQYVDFAAWQKSWLQGEVLERELDYWKKTLAGAPTLLELPTQFPRPTIQSGSGAREPFYLDKELTDSLINLGRAHNTTLFTVLMAAYNVLLYRYSGQKDLLVGSGIANRSQPELEGLVGFFADTWVLRTDLGHEPGFGALLASVKTEVLAAFDHGDISFDQIVDTLKIPRELGYSPLVQVMFILNNAPPSRIDLPELSLTLIDQKREIAKMDMVLSLSESAEGLSGTLEYNTDIFDQPSMARFLVHFRGLLSLVIEDLETPISQLRYLTQEEEILQAKEHGGGDIGAVEAQLLEAEQVAACRVVLRQVCTAYVVPKNRFNEHELRRFATERLDPGQCPEIYVPVSQLPLCLSGAVDEAALAEIAVVNEDLERSLELALKAAPGVVEAAVLRRDYTAGVPALHLSQLIPEPLGGSRNQDPSPDREVSAPPAELSGGLAQALGEPLQLEPGAPTTLVEVLERAARFETGIHYLLADDTSTFSPYGALLEDAEHLLGGLRSAGLQAGDKVLFQLESHASFVPAFWACVLGGFVPVPVAVPPDYQQSSGALNLLNNARALLNNPVILIDGTGGQRLIEHLPGPEPARVLAVADLSSCGRDSRHHPCRPDDLALMLLTSGSTGKPKAVQQSHGALVYRSAATTQQNAFNRGDISLNWMPLDHVGGLVMFHIRDVYALANQIQTPKDGILQAPTRWLDIMERFKVTVTWAPNFAYGLINDSAEKITQGSWDLSSVRFILNGGEAVVARTARGFLKLLAPFGLSPDCMYPAWGMSETCSGVTYASDFNLKTSSDDDPFVFVGRPIPGFSVRVTDETDRVVDEGNIGRLQVKGPSVTSGYYDNPEQNKLAFTSDGWFDTGDLGILRDGCLAITGREKDAIIINGINYSGSEIEAAVEELAGVTVSYTAACAIREEGVDTDLLGIFFNPDEAFPDRAALLRQIRERVVETVGVAPRYLIPVSRETIPKTGIGKIQRAQLVTRFDQGAFHETLKETDLLLENEHTLPSWFYRPVWRRCEEEASGGRGPLLVFMDKTGLGESLLAHDEVSVGVEAGDSFQALGSNRFQIDAENPEHYRRLFQNLPAFAKTFERLLFLWTYDAGDGSDETVVDAQKRGIFSLLYLHQALLEKTDGRLRLFVCTTRACQVNEQEPIALENATLPGFVKTLAQEHPGLSVRLLDLNGDPEVDAVSVRRELGLRTNAELVAYRNGRRFTLLLARETFSGQTRPLPFRQDGTYVISGGLGGVAGHLARFLLDHYAAKLLLLGRRPITELDSDSLPRAGSGQVTYQAVDISDKNALAKVLAPWKQVDGVLHLAGTYADCALRDETPRGMWATLAPKLLGALNLASLLPEAGLFISFSSVTALFGARDGGAYAAANSFLAGHTQALRARGIEAFCFDWAAWEEIGMSRGYGLGDLFRERGYRGLSARQAVLSFRAGLHLGQPRLMIGLDESKSFVRRQVDGPSHGLVSLAGFYTTAAGVMPDLPRLVDRFGRFCEGALEGVEELPRLANGEIDREALLAIASGSTNSPRRIPPRNDEERRIAAIWLDLLPINALSIHDNFFQVGGHSLLATQVVSRIQESWGLSFSLRSLFGAPTVAGIAAELARLKTDQLHDLPLVPQSREGQVPLSFAQQRLWFINQLEGDNEAYNIPFALRFSGALDIQVFEAAIDAIVQRHESLRTHFGEQEGLPTQVIVEQVQLQIRFVDLSFLEDRQDVALSLTRREAAHVFNLARGPLLRVTLLHLAEAENLLLFTMHHIVSDGWSAGVLVDEFAQNYKAFLNGLPSPLPPLPVQYPDFSIWQRRRASVIEGQLAYWVTQLADLPELLDLPCDKPRPRVQSQRSAGLTTRLPLELSQEIEQLGGRGITLFMTLLAAFQILLGRYSGQRVFAVGSPIANRFKRELEPMIGFFVNTLVLRADLSDNPTVNELLERVKETSLAAYANQEVPFEQVVEAIKPRRDQGYSPLFQVMLTLQNAPGGKEDLPHLEIRPVEREITASKFDLCLRLAQLPDGISGVLEYKTDLFLKETALAFLNHFSAILVEMSARPHARINELAVITVHERQYQLEELNRNAVAFDRTLCIPRLFEDQVLADPDGPAVFYRPETSFKSISKATLLEQVKALGGHLQALGVGPEDRVAIAVTRSLDMVVGELAILFAGAVFVPIDPNFPEARINAIFEDARPRCLLTQATLGNRWPVEPVVFLPLEAETARLQRPNICSENLAYIIYTSGTTGRPKGVGVSHRAFHNYLLGLFSRLEISAGDVWDTWSILAADHSHTATFGALCAGAALRINPEEDALDPNSSPRVLGENKSAFSKMVPSLLEHFLAASQPARFLPEGYLMVAGDASRWSTLEKVWALDPSIRVLNSYGPTETAVACLIGEVNRQGPSEFASVPIGRPLLNVSVYILDRYLNVLPRGVAGELLIGGEGPARGYWNRPAATAEKFIPDPFSKTPGSRMYHSGDLVRYHHDGNVLFLGRIDHQVKIRGYRIELDEIRNLLEAHPEVEEALVTLVKQKLVAYVAGAGTVEESSLREHLKVRLPAYMVPAAFVRLDALPLTALGKLDRARLPDPAASGLAEGDIEAGRTPTEQMLVALWSEILEAPIYDRRADFFENGGHSLLAVQLVVRVMATFEVQLNVRDLFDAPTPALLAVRVEASRALPQTPMEKLAHDQPNGRFPVSFGQQRLWFLDRLEGPNASYNIPIALRLSGNLRVDALRRALEEIKRRHAVLRTTIAVEEGVPYQVVSQDNFLPVAEVNLTDLSPERRASLAEKLIGEEAALAFDLKRGPLFRVRLIRESKTDWLLLVTMHHICADGWSNGIFISELTCLYNAYLAGQPSPLPELSHQYIDYAAWQQQLLNGPELERQLDYWREHLAGAPPLLTLPTDRPRPPVQSYRGATENFALPPALAQALTALGRRHQATVFMTLITAFKVLLARYSGQDDICVGTPIANRNRAELEPMIGFFANTLVLRTQLEKQTSFADLLDRVKAHALAAYTHADVPFEKVIEATSPERNRGHAPLFQVMFSMRNTGAQAASPQGIEITPVARELGFAQFDLSLVAEHSADGISAFLQFNRDLFERGSVRNMVTSFITLLESVTADPELALGRLELLAPLRKQQVLEEWNQTATTMPESPLLHGLFERQARRVPDAVAISFEVAACTRQMTYRHLDRQANQLASQLIALGVAVEQPVGLFLERSPDMMVGILAILKVGAIYVPLEPGFPKRRLAYILEDTRIELAITQTKFRAQLEELGVQPVLPSGSGESQPPERRVDPFQAAYLIFTSGSTGRPKGVTIAQRSIVNRVNWIIRFLGLTGFDRVLQRTPFGFDASVWELFTPLFCGGGLVFAEPASHGDAAYLIRSVKELRVTVAQMVPSLLAVLLEHPSVRDLASLRYLCCGGEAYPLKTFTRFSELGLTTRLVNLYGPTEVSIDATGRLLENEVFTPIPIGKPIDNMRCYVLDDLITPVPVGVVGELFIGGVGLARGYWKRPAQTAERFIPNPYALEAGERLYRSGDRTRQTWDGAIHFLGRNDHQIKLRGFRIEVGEIESLLDDQPGVSRSLVTLAAAGNGEEALVAYLLTAAGDQINRADLRHYLQERLPAYMVPGYFVALDKWPLLSSGKLNRAALPALSTFDQEEQSLDKQEPRDTTELRLKHIWQELLGRDDLGINDNFFQAGGHSLLCVRLLAAVQREFGRELSLATLFQAATIAALAQALRDSEQPGHWSPLVPMQAGGEGPPLYCMHPPSGTVMCYAALAQALKANRPVYGLRARGLEEGQEPIEGIKAMATAYLEAILERQPEGPYHLLGWSAGGLLAYELAGLLVDEGREVAFLGLVDTGLAAAGPDEEPEQDATLVLLKHWAAELGIEGESLDGREDPLAYLLETAKGMGVLPPDYTLSQAERRVRVSVSHSQAAGAYQPEVYGGEVFLYRAAEGGSLSILGPDLGWCAYLGEGPRVVGIPGNHFSLMQAPHVSLLAQKVRESLQGKDEAALEIV